MVVQTTDLVSKEQLDEYVAQAAKAAAYEKGFGASGCDLSQAIWWVGYARQSLDEQTKNNRLPEYLLTLAKMARDQGIVVPREYVLFDHETGEHLDRPAMSFLRRELVHKQKIAGVLFADLRCLSREPAPQQVFERECELLGVKLMFGDAPSGMDVGSQFARSAITFSNKLARLANNRNARAGNIGRVLKGSVPSTKAPYGYTYRRDAEITQDGRVRIKRAWWDVDKLDSEGNLIPESPADVVKKVFTWIGLESSTCHWVAKRLNEIGARAPGGGTWSPGKVQRLVYNHCYTGKHTYNANVRVLNPKRPLGDITGAIKRTLLRPKPQGEAVEFNVPVLVTEELWLKATQLLKKRGRGRGKQGQTILALLRNRIFCPRCGKPMVVRRKSGRQVQYYHCSRHYRIWSPDYCTYRGFVPGNWDDIVWDVVYCLLKQDAWVEERLSAVTDQVIDWEKMTKQEEKKILQAQAKIARIREGFEGGIYGIEEAKVRIASYQAVIEKAEQETERIHDKMGSRNSMTIDPDALKRELQKLAEENLDEATFEDKRDVINKLDVRVYPTEDLKTMKIRCGLNLDIKADGRGSAQNNGCGIVMFGLLASKDRPLPRVF